MSGAWGIATWHGQRAQNEIKAPLDGGVRICIFEGRPAPPLVERLDAIDVGGCSLGLRGAAAQAEWRTFPARPSERERSEQCAESLTRSSAVSCCSAFSSLAAPSPRTNMPDLPRRPLRPPRR